MHYRHFQKRQQSVEVQNMKLCHCCCCNRQCRHSLGDLAHNAINSEFYILIVAMGHSLLAALNLVALCRSVNGFVS